MTSDRQTEATGRKGKALGAGLAAALIAVIADPANAGSVTVTSIQSAANANASVGHSEPSGWSGSVNVLDASDGNYDSTTDVALSSEALSAQATADFGGRSSAATAQSGVSLSDVGGVFTYAATGSGSAFSSHNSPYTSAVGESHHQVELLLDGVFDYELNIDFANAPSPGDFMGASLYNLTTATYLQPNTTADVNGLTGQLGSGSYRLYFYEQARSGPYYSGRPYSSGFTGLQASLVLTEVPSVPPQGVVPLPTSAFLGLGMMLALGLAWVRRRTLGRRLFAATERI